MSKRGSISNGHTRDPVAGASGDLVSLTSSDSVSCASEAAASALPRKGDDGCASDGAGGHEGSWACASHDALFTPLDEIRCDACGCEMPDRPAGEQDDLGGRGVYLWTRGDEARLEEVPLCASCASAIGMTALARWEIEEEEG